jgi:hypothetical protein
MELRLDTLASSTLSASDSFSPTMARSNASSSGCITMSTSTVVSRQPRSTAVVPPTQDTRTFAPRLAAERLHELRDPLPIG